jgi:hypothetical protein
MSRQAHVEAAPQRGSILAEDIIVQAREASEAFW